MHIQKFDKVSIVLIVQVIMLVIFTSLLFSQTRANQAIYLLCLLQNPGMTPEECASKNLILFNVNLLLILYLLQLLLDLNASL